MDIKAPVGASGRSLDDIVTSIKTDILQCSHCHIRNKTHILTCSHSFCSQCLLELREGDAQQVVCPICTVVTQIPQPQEDQTQPILPYPDCLPQSAHLTSLAEAMTDIDTKFEDLKLITNRVASSVAFERDGPSVPRAAVKGGTVLCGNNCGRSASLFCPQCKAVLCDVCSQQLHSLRVFRNHVPLPTKGPHCQQHPGKTTHSLCCDCRQLLCDDCSVDHAGHQVCLLSEVTSESAPQRQTAANLERVGLLVSRLGKHAQKSEEEAVTARAVVEKHYSELLSSVDLLQNDQRRIHPQIPSLLAWIQEAEKAEDASQMSSAIREGQRLLDLPELVSINSGVSSPAGRFTLDLPTPEGVVLAHNYRYGAIVTDGYRYGMLGALSQEAGEHFAAVRWCGDGLDAPSTRVQLLVDTGVQFGDTHCRLTYADCQQPLPGVDSYHCQLTRMLDRELQAATLAVESEVTRIVPRMVRDTPRGVLDTRQYAVDAPPVPEPGAPLHPGPDWPLGIPKPLPGQLVMVRPLEHGRVVARLSIPAQPPVEVALSTGQDGLFQVGVPCSSPDAMPLQTGLLVDGVSIDGTVYRDAEGRSRLLDGRVLRDLSSKSQLPAPSLAAEALAAHVEALRGVLIRKEHQLAVSNRICEEHHDYVEGPICREADTQAAQSAHSAPAVAVQSPIEDAVVTVSALIPGAVVVRGPGWSWGSTDAAPGYILGRAHESGWARVIWSDGTTASYRCFDQGPHDLCYAPRSTPPPREHWGSPVCPALIRRRALVVRGFHWPKEYGTQDGDSCGLILGTPRDHPGWVVVRWTRGGNKLYRYRIGAEDKLELVYWDHPVTASNAAVGALVGRGPDWSEGGDGLGSIKSLNTPSAGWCSVSWGDGKVVNHRIGAEGKHELMLAK